MPMNTKILIVDDDENICVLLNLYLSKEGYDCEVVHNGREAINRVNSFNPELILLDIMLPEIDGLEVCREVRKTSNVPIIFLTAKGETFDKVLGLELGADDYIVKPFEPKELLARVKARLRRINTENTSGIVAFDDLIINITDYTVLCKGKSLEMPPKELELLYFFAKNPNKVFTREQLLEQVWEFEYFGDSRTVDVHIKRIREKIGDGNTWSLKTVWGIGYKFEVK